MKTKSILNFRFIIVSFMIVNIIVACKSNPVDGNEDEIDEEFVTNTKDTTFVDAVSIVYSDTSVTVTIRMLEMGLMFP